MTNLIIMLTGFALGTGLTSLFAMIMSMESRAENEQLKEDIKYSDEIAELLERKHTRLSETYHHLSRNLEKEKALIASQSRLIADLEKEITNLKKNNDDNK